MRVLLLMGRDDESKPADNREKSEGRKGGGKKRTGVLFVRPSQEKEGMDW